MRSRTRIKPILELIETIWELNPDLRLGQLLENAGISFSTEDVNTNINKLCSHYNLPFKYWALWGTRPNPEGQYIVYKKLESLSTAHLKNIVKEPLVPKNLQDVIFELLEDRGEFDEEEAGEEVDDIEVIDVDYNSFNNCKNCTKDTGRFHNSFEQKVAKEPTITYTTISELTKGLPNLEDFLKSEKKKGYK